MVPSVRREGLVVGGLKERSATLDLRRGIGESAAMARQRSPSKIGESSSSSESDSSSDSDERFLDLSPSPAACSSVQVSMQPEISPEARILLLCEKTTHRTVRS